MALKAGDDAPDFELRSHRGGTVKLSSFKGRKNVVLAFHPLAFTPVCANQMSGYQAELPRFDAVDAAILGISIDAQPAKAAWATALGSISYDLLSDFHPHGAVAEQLRRVQGQRGVFGTRGIRDRQGREGRLVAACTRFPSCRTRRDFFRASETPVR